MTVPPTTATTPTTPTTQTTQTRLDLTTLPRPLAVVFSSGGGRCAAQVGMMDELASAGLEPDLVVGSSFGSINAATYGSVESHAYHHATAMLAGLWHVIGTESVFASPGVSIASRFTVSRGVRATREMREILGTCIPDVSIADSRTPIVPVTTNLRTGHRVAVEYGSLLDAALASCAVPVLLKPVEVGQLILFDGGFTECVPLDEALIRGAKSIILLDAGSSTVAERELPNLRWWEIAAVAYGHLLRGQAGHALQKAGSAVPVLTIGTGRGNVFDFSRPDDMFEAGQRAARDALATHGLMEGPGLYGVPIGFEDYAPIQDLIRSPGPGVGTVKAM